MSQLIIVTGPIGAGKSTVALRLAEQLRDSGRSAAVVDLDDVFAMVSAWSELSEVAWERARRVHGALVAAWLRSGVDVVIAHGPFYTPEETAPLLAEILPTQQQRWVMLLAPFEVALERVKDDPLREFSKDPSFLRWTHERFNELLPDISTCQWTFDTTTMSADEIASALVDSLPAMDR